MDMGWLKYIFQIILVSSSVSCNEKLSEVLLNKLNYNGTHAMNRKGLKVFVLGSLYQLVDVDQRNNLATVSAYFDLRWTDNELTWDPDMYNGTIEMYLPRKAVWLPELYLYHSVEGSTPIGIQDSAVHVTYDGEVGIFVPFTARALCPINVKYFPFDEQWCNFTFGSWSYKLETVEFQVGNSSINLAEFYDNQEWVLTNSMLLNGTSRYETMSRQELYSTVTMHLSLKRESFYYVFNLMIPTTLVSLTAIVGFHAPSRATCGRDSKFRLGITTLLSMGVMLLMVVDEMPKFSLSSQPGQRGSFSDVPVLGLFYLSLILTISLGTCTSSIFVILEKYGAKRSSRSQIPILIRWLDFDCPSFPCLRWKLLNRQPPQMAGDFSDDFEFGVIPEENNALIKNKGFVLKENSTHENHVTSSPLSKSYNSATMGSVSKHLSEFLFEKEIELLEHLCKLASQISGHLAAIVEEKHQQAVEPASKRHCGCLCKSWRRVISRLELCSLFVYFGLICLFVLMFFYPDSWY